MVKSLLSATLVSIAMLILLLPSIAADNLTSDDLYRMYDLSNSVVIADFVHLDKESSFALYMIKGSLKGIRPGVKFIKVKWTAKKLNSPITNSSWVLFLTDQLPSTEVYSTYKGEKGILPYTQKVERAIDSYRWKNKGLKSRFRKELNSGTRERYNPPKNPLKDFLEGRSDHYYGYDLIPLRSKRKQIKAK